MQNLSDQDSEAARKKREKNLKHAIQDQAASLWLKCVLNTENKVAIALVTIICGTFLFGAITATVSSLNVDIRAWVPTSQPGENVFRRVHNNKGYYGIQGLKYFIGISPVLLVLFPFAFPVGFRKLSRPIMRRVVRYAVLRPRSLEPIQLILECASRHPECMRIARALYYDGMKDIEMYEHLRASAAKGISGFDGYLTLSKPSLLELQKIGAGTAKPKPASVVMQFRNANIRKVFSDVQVAENEPYHFAVFSPERQEYVAAESAWVTPAHDRGPRDIKPHILKDTDSGQNFCIGEMENVEPPRVRARTASYGDIMCSSDVLIHELLITAGIRRKLERQSGEAIDSSAWKSADEMLRNMPLRRCLLEKSGDLLFTKPSHHAAGIGMAFTTIYAREGNQYEMIFARRSGTVATYPRVLHVVPAGMCNQRDLNLDPSSYIPLAIVSEALEEMFGYKKLEDFKGHKWEEAVRTAAMKVCGNGKYKFSVHVTGIAYDLFNYRPEICGVILIDSPKFYEEVVKPSFERALSEKSEMKGLQEGLSTAIEKLGEKTTDRNISRQSVVGDQHGGAGRKDDEVPNIKLNWEYEGHMIQADKRSVYATEWVQSGLASAELAARWIDEYKSLSSDEQSEKIKLGVDWKDL